MTGAVRDTGDAAVQNAVRDDELFELFAGLSAFRSLLVAVSGGADSVALVRLVARWAASAGVDAPIIEAATIDHGLRATSGAEAQWAAGLSASLGIRHTIRKWGAAKPVSGLQAAAREARYQLLTEIVQERNLPLPAAILTAHTEDDQAETFIMRLARGSGIDGLAGMRERRQAGRAIDEIFIVRPMLGVAKSRLVATLRAVAQDWLEDPSNQAVEFERVRIRRAMPLLMELGLTTEAIALSARRAARSWDALREVTHQFEVAHIDLHNGAYGSVAREDYEGAPEDVRLRVLQRLLYLFGGAGRVSVRLAKIEGLSAKLEREPVVTATLGGCVVESRAGVIAVYREPGRMPLPVTGLRPGQCEIWDGRFRVHVAPAAGCELDDEALHLTVRALGEEGARTVRGELGQRMNLPLRAAATLPSFWLGGTLIAVPTIGLQASNYGNREALGPVPPFDCVAEFIG